MQKITFWPASHCLVTQDSIIDCCQHFSGTIYWDVWLWLCFGLAIASYEWMAAITLIIVGKFFTHFYWKRLVYYSRICGEKVFNQSEIDIGCFLDLFVRVCEPGVRTLLRVIST